MAVRVADSLKQQNDLKTFPVAYSEDIWIDKNKGEGDANYKDLQTLYNEGALGGSGLPEPESKDKLLLSVENEETSELEWSQVDKDTVGSSPFIGTEEEWESLSLEEKAKYKIVNFLDDDGSGKFIEIGENENGFYKKWANGILEQWGHLGKVATGYQTGTKTLPMSFINNDYITILSASYAGNSYAPCVTAQNNDSFNYYNLTNATGFASYYAIGKWK